MSEFEKAYYESDTFWENEMLQDTANLRRFANTAALIPEDTRSLLDAGCGNGVFIKYLGKERPSLVLHGMDRSNAALKFVESEKTLGDVTSMPFPDASFDCVTCLEVLEHLPIEAYAKAVRELFRVSRKYIIVSVPYNEVLEDSHTQCPSCRSIFNYELHLRSFSSERFENLFEGYPVRVVRSQKDGLSERFVGHDAFRRTFYKEQFLKWNSPICPICGYTEPKAPVSHQSASQHQSDSPQQLSAKQRVISAFTALPKLFWPKESRYYWIMGLFEKTA